ncbi:MAG: hypothetical protein HGA37_10115, partial [Lentimicrobium sp.]|nr:hypothetical protein [Lentimicrobium sp.]
GFPEEQKFKANNGVAAFKPEQVDLFNALESTDAQYLETMHKKLGALSAEINLTDDEIVLSW